jgi:hypothetical protein
VTTKGNKRRATSGCMTAAALICSDVSTDIKGKDEIDVHILHNITWCPNETPRVVCSDPMASVVDNCKREVLPVSTKVGLDREECLFDGVEVRGIGGEEYELAHGLVFKQRPNLLRVVDVAVVEYKHAAGAGIMVGEGDDKFPQELNEALRSNRSRDNVMGDDAVDGENGKDGIALSTDKIPVLNAAPSHERPASGSP